MDHQGADKQRYNQRRIGQRLENGLAAQSVGFFYLDTPLFYQEQGNQKADEHQPSGNEKHHAQPQVVRHQSAEQRAGDHSGNLTGGQGAQRPTAFIARHLRGNQRHCIGDIAGGQAHQRTQRKQLINVSDHALQCNDNSHAQRGAQQHQLAAFAVRQAAPQR